MCVPRPVCPKQLCDYNGVGAVAPVLISSTAVNTSTCIAKDRAFARMFGTIKAAPVPAPSYAFWLARDLISMGCVFSIPPILSSYLQVNPLIKYALHNSNAPLTSHLISLAFQETTALGERASGLAAQFTVPLLAQAPLSALHLSGLDFYNRRGVSTTDRIEFLRAEVHFDGVILSCPCRCAFPRYGM